MDSALIVKQLMKFNLEEQARCIQLPASCGAAKYSYLPLVCLFMAAANW